MKTKNVVFPYPVIGHDNDVHAKFSAHLDCEEKEGIYNFSLLLNTDNAEVLDLIAQGKALYACDVDCNKTFMRFCTTSAGPQIDINLRATDVADKVVFAPFILASGSFRYSNKDFHKDYAGQTFDMNAGEILAVAPEIPVYFDLTNARNDRGGDIVVFDRTNEPYTHVNLSNDKISVELPSAIYDLYLGSKNEFPHAIMAMFVTQAFTEAFRNLDSAEYEGKRWNDELRHRINNDNAFTDYRDYDSTECDDGNIPFEMAQVLLKDCYTDALNSLNHRQENNG